MLLTNFHMPSDFYQLLVVLRGVCNEDVDKTMLNSIYTKINKKTQSPLMNSIPL